MSLLVIKKMNEKKYFENEGIQLDKDNINNNPALQSIMKLILNSFWVRFGMQTNKTKVKFISKLRDWYNMLSDDTNIIHDVDFGIDNVFSVYYSENKNFHEESTQINMCIAAFVHLPV